MNDGYDIYCIMKVGEQYNTPAVMQYQEVDEVTCACADYLKSEGYMASSDNHNTINQRAMTSAAQLIPTTSNLLTQGV